MKRNLLVYALLAAVAATLAAQQAGSSGPYQGTSNPPPDDSIVTASDAVPAPAPALKPPAGQPASAQPAAPMQFAAQPAPPAEVVPPAPAQPMGGPADGTDDGIVQVAPSTPDQPSLSQRQPLYDPDGDIVHPASLPPGQLGEGAVIRVRLLDGLSTAYSQDGQKFRSRVASDVMQDGQVLIPAGSEIDGTVTSVSSGRMGGHGSMHLRPETVILNDGSRFRMYAQVSGAPGSGARVDTEGGINPGSRLKRDGIEYGGAVGAGAVTGAMLGGPGGALAGTLIGAGVITAHLLISHPQATLDSGTVLLFTLNQPLNLVPAAVSGN